RAWVRRARRAGGATRLPRRPRLRGPRRVPQRGAHVPRFPAAGRLVRRAAVARRAVEREGAAGGARRGHGRQRLTDGPQRSLPARRALVVAGGGVAAVAATLAALAVLIAAGGHDVGQAFGALWPGSLGTSYAGRWATLVP